MRNMEDNIKILRVNKKSMPIYRELETHFADLIIRKQIEPGTRLPSINETAKSRGANARTVSHAYQRLADRGLVEIRNGSGTFVIDSVHSTKTTAIGLIGWSDHYENTDLSELHYGAKVYAGIRAEAAVRGITYHWLDETNDINQACAELEISGCIVANGNTSVAPIIAELEKYKIKTISIGGYDEQTVPCVRGDDIQGMQLLVEHLLQLGHTRIALFNAGLDNYSARRRFEAYMDAMQKADLSIHPAWIHNSLAALDNRTEEEKMIKSWFECALPPTAIIAAGDRLSLAVLQFLNRRGLRVPEEVSVCGYDEIPGVHSLTPPAMTVVKQPVMEIGRMAMRNLINLLGGESVSHTVMPVELVVRDSTSKYSAV